MASNTIPVFILNPKAWVVSVAAAGTTTAQTIVTAGSNGTRIEHLIVQASEVKTVDFTVVLGGVIAFLWRTTLAANVSKDVLAEMLAYVDKQYLVLGSGAVLKYAVTVTLTSTNTCTVYADGGDY